MDQTPPTITLRCQFCDTWNRVNPARLPERPKCGKCARFLLIDRPYPLFEDSFARTIADSDIPVIVDFYADWCGPCKMMAPAVDELAARNAGSVLVAKLNTDAAPQISQAYNIRGIPTTVVFRGGKEVARQSGAIPLATLQQLLDRAVAA
jgi:thioredoxin 2